MVDHPFFFEGNAGKLEAIYTIPANKRDSHIAILGHPHSLHGGAMSNKVVTTLARAFAELGIASIRFNFRGVGKSEGVYDAGIGESEDMLALARICQEDHPEIRFIFAGFSFGSYVAYRAAEQCPHDLLILVAPPVHHFAYVKGRMQSNLDHPEHTVIFQGDEDEIVPVSEVLAFAKSFVPELPVYCFANTGHFFHGKLIQLKETLIEVVQEKVWNL